MSIGKLLVKRKNINNSNHGGHPVILFSKKKKGQKKSINNGIRRRNGQTLDEILKRKIQYLENRVFFLALLAPKEKRRKL